MNSPERRETCSLWGNFHVLEREAAHSVERKGREEDTPTTSRTGKFAEVYGVGSKYVKNIV